MGDYHDMTHTLPLWRSEVGREIMGTAFVEQGERTGLWFLHVEPEGSFCLLGAVPDYIRDALAWRTLAWLDERGGAFECDRGETAFIRDHDKVFAEAMRVAGVGDG